MLRRLLVPSLLVVAFLLPAAPAGATLLRQFDLTGLSEAAAVVVRGRVATQQSRRDADTGRIYTYSEVDVLEVVKGRDVPARITVQQIGGDDGELVMTVAGTADLAVGEEVVLFLRTDGRFHYLVGMQQGKYGVRRDGAVAWVTRDPLRPEVDAVPAAAGATVVRTFPRSSEAGVGGGRAARLSVDELLDTVRRHVRTAEERAARAREVAPSAGVAPPATPAAAPTVSPAVSK